MITNDRVRAPARRVLAVAASAVIGTVAMTGLADAATADGPTGAPAASPSSTTARTTVAKAAASCWYSGNHWWCKNRSGAKVVDRYGQLVGYMYTTTSWFNYRCEGGRNNNGPHPNRWEYTQADNGRWGYMSDGDISSETNTLPDYGRC